MRSKLLQSVILAGSVMTLLTPMATAAAGWSGRIVTQVVRLEVVSLDCDSRGEANCLNLITRLEWDGPSKSGTLCVDVGDFRAVHPPVAHGCTTLPSDALSMDVDGGIVVAPTVVPAVYSEDCYNTDPTDGCVPRSVALSTELIARFASTPADSYTRSKVKDGRCHTKVESSTLQGDAIVALRIDGFAYQLPTVAGDPHTASSVLSIVTTRTRSHC